MSSISIYLSPEQEKNLDKLMKTETAKGTNRSTLVGTLIDQEIARIEEAEMLEDAVYIDQEQLGWDEEEERCQIIDQDQSGL